MPEEIPKSEENINPIGGVHTEGGNFVGHDKIVYGDEVRGDKNIFQGDVTIYKDQPITLPPAQIRDRHELGILLDRVDKFWIEGVLNKSLHTIALIDLRKETQAEAVAHAWDQILELPDQSRQTLPPSKKISNVFDELNRGLLILGEPGSGKTVTLLQLARDLIEKARADSESSQPIPVIFNLSSWSATQQSLFDWIIEELVSKYHIPRRIGRHWLENNRLLLLLDGLDEVQHEHQVECVNAINHFAEEYGLVGMAVCCRLQEYISLPVRLRLSGAIRLLPLTLDQVYEYLNAAGGKLEMLRMALQEDEDLQIMARSPLILGIMSLAYMDISEEIKSEKADYSIEMRRKKLLDTYIERMLKRKGMRKERYSDEQGINWLSWLAAQMCLHNQSMFQIEALQPDWGLSKSSIFVYILVSRFLIGLIVGFILTLMMNFTRAMMVGLLGGLASAILGWYWTSHQSLDKFPHVLLKPFWMIERFVLVGLSVFLLIFTTVFFLNGPFVGFALGLIGCAVFSVTYGLRPISFTIGHDIRTVESIRLNPKRGVKYGVLGTVIGIVFGILGETIYRIGFGVPVIAHPDQWLGTIMLTGIAGGLAGIVYGSLTPALLDEKTVPNQGIHLSLRNGAVAGLVVGLIITIFGGILGNFLGDFVRQLSGGLYKLYGGFWGGLRSGLIGGLLVALWFGWLDAIHHYCLRLLLSLCRKTPLAMPNLLEYAEKRVLVQRVGGGFIFIHRMLMEHFAAMYQETNSNKQ